METNTAPIVKFRTNRGMLKFVLLSMLTFGIYGIVCLSHISSEINIIARNDGKSTTHFCLMYFLYSWLTLGIAPLVWYTRISGRIGEELCRRNLPYSFGAGSYWGWHIFGSLILIGPFVYTHKLMKAMNFLAADYNVRG